MNKKLLLLILLFLYSSLLITQTEQREKILRIGYEQDIAIFNPWAMRYQFDAKLFRNILEPLVSLDENSTKIKPLLAKSWRVSNNNRTWLLKLREGVKFHDNSTLSADDVVASVSLFEDFEARVEKIDNTTIRFILPEPNSRFICKLADPKYGIIPAKTVPQFKSLSRDARSSNIIPVGTGPFELSHWDKGKQIILESFSGYWQGEPWLSRLIYKIIPDGNNRIQALEKGEIDILDVLMPQDLQRLRKNLNFNIINKNSTGICYVALNTTRKSLDNKNVRKALNLAVDRMKITRMFYYGGYGVPTDRILSPAFWGFNIRPSTVKYDPTESRRILNELGYDTGITLKLIPTPWPRYYLPDPQGVSEKLQEFFLDIGVKIDIIVPNDWAEFESIIKSRNYDMILYGWVDPTGDPGMFLNTFLSYESTPLNYAHWHNKAFSDKLKKARELPIADVAGRIRLYNEAQEIFQDEVPWIPLVHTKINVVLNQKIKGLIVYPNGIISYHKVKFDARFSK